MLWSLYCKQVESIVKGVCFGVVLALCILMLGYLVRKHPERAKKILLSFIRTNEDHALIGLHHYLFSCFAFFGRYRDSIGA